ENTVGVLLAWALLFGTATAAYFVLRISRIWNLWVSWVQALLWIFFIGMAVQLVFSSSVHTERNYEFGTSAQIVNVWIPATVTPLALLLVNLPIATAIARKQSLHAARISNGRLIQIQPEQAPALADCIANAALQINRTILSPAKRKLDP